MEKLDFVKTYSPFSVSTMTQSKCYDSFHSEGKSVFYNDLCFDYLITGRSMDTVLK